MAEISKAFGVGPRNECAPVKDVSAKRFKPLGLLPHGGVEEVFEDQHVVAWRLFEPGLLNALKRAGGRELERQLVRVDLLPGRHLGVGALFAHFAQPPRQVLQLHC